MKKLITSSNPCLCVIDIYVLSTGRQMAIPIVFTICGKYAPTSLSSEMYESTSSTSERKSGNRIMLIAFNIDSSNCLSLKLNIDYANLLKRKI